MKNEKIRNLNDVNWPPVAAAEGTHQKVLELLFDLVPVEGSKILDLPCGAGALASALEQLSYDVSTMDIHPNDPYFADETKRKIADANERLPFDAESFDAVCSVEGIEHLENPSFFLRELCRVAKVGAYVILTTPNVDGYKSRKNLFFRGFHRFFKPESGGSKESGHLLPIDYFFVMNAVKKTDLRFVGIFANSIGGVAGKTAFREFIRKHFTKSYPEALREITPFYGEVAIYLFKRV